MFVVKIPKFSDFPKFLRNWIPSHVRAKYFRREQKFKSGGGGYMRTKICEIVICKNSKVHFLKS